jgi:hypothetical protein
MLYSLSSPVCERELRLSRAECVGVRFFVVVLQHRAWDCCIDRGTLHCWSVLAFADSVSGCSATEAESFLAAFLSFSRIHPFGPWFSVCGPGTVSAGSGTFSAASVYGHRGHHGVSVGVHLGGDWLPVGTRGNRRVWCGVLALLLHPLVHADR